MRRLSVLLRAGAVLLLVAACHSSTTPSRVVRADLLRSWTATTFIAAGGGATVDQLARGASLTLTLQADGTTAGHVHLPGSDAGSTVDADLAGTFSFDERTAELTFQQAADTFLRDMPFTAVRASDGLELIGEATFGGTTLRVILR